MTTYQTGANVLVALKRETTTGVAATAAGASQMRAIQSPGLVRARAQIQSAEKRSDMLQTLGRLGGVSVTGSYNAELTVGGVTDILLEAIMRSTWVPAFTVGLATMTTVAFGSNTLTAAAGDWINTQNVRVGDIFTVANTSLAANNGTNARVVAVTTLTITTTPGAFTTLAATATGTMTFMKKVKNGATPVRYSHTFEQYNQDIDLSEMFLGVRAIGVKLSYKPGAMAQISYTLLGLDRTPLTTGTSPWFTSPSLTTGLDLIADDSTIRFNGANIATFTGFDLDFTITAKNEPVIGSFISPDVFDNNLMVSGTITALRQDFSNLTLYDAETEFDVSMLLQEPTGSPKACLGFFFPRVKISALSAPFASDGAMQETLTLMVGPKVAATGYDAGYCTIHSSAP